MSSVVAIAAGDADADALRATKEKIKSVLHLIRKDASFTPKQLEFCKDSCVERYLKARGYNTKKAAKHLKATLAWRHTYDVDFMIADEFAAELASGIAYVAGHDSEGRPVVVVRRKKFSYGGCSQKQYLRYLIFTMEVAVASMGPGVNQWVLIIDIGNSKLTSPSSSTILGSLKIINEHYPGRLAKAFVVDCPAVFYYLWKSICTFVDNGTKGKLTFVSSKDHGVYQAQMASSRCNSTSEGSRRNSVSEGSRRNSTSEEPPSIRRLLYESPSFRARQPERSASNDSALLNGPHCRSFSFTSMGRTINSSVLRRNESSSFRADKNLWVPAIVTLGAGSKLRAGEGHSFRLGKRPEKFSAPLERKEKLRNSFRPYWRIFKADYNESAYRATMKPPLGGLKSILTYSTKTLKVV
ncbi:hypothetical protein R1sor_024118 [Riccia sorocarpa]|uniref:CRAL-TRIO domain-containing protein n=1 Tax=Riccia sorocarpa TaxID=122646 RepID=A0ABD3GRS5_9MARC